ncbi:MAG TPA: hypothetical protein DCQ77_07720 [Betaproteobacteria bacterium]|nr:hypothetical protein [Betaproteobacteria bacterium]
MLLMKIPLYNGVFYLTTACAADMIGLAALNLSNFTVHDTRQYNRLCDYAAAMTQPAIRQRHKYFIKRPQTGVDA